jgi:hypothetical protein
MSIEKEDKTNMSNLTTAYFEILKSEKQVDGTIMVYGKATDDSLDIDQQICDATWLDRAMPQWFKTGGNIREQHSNIAAGVAKEYELKADGHYILTHVVDPVSVKKVEAGVLRGFSIGIKSPRVVRDEKAANGRIIDGQIVEISLVDRPANPNCQLVLAKSVDGESTLVQSEELYEFDTNIEKKKTDYSKIIPNRKGEPADKKLYAAVIAAAKRKFDVYPSAVANAWVSREYKKRGGTYKSGKSADENMVKASDLISEAREIAGDITKFDQGLFDTARQALAKLIMVEAEEMSEGSNEQLSLSHLLEAVKNLFAWYQGEESEGEVMSGNLELSAHKDMKPKDGESKSEFMARCKEAGMSDDDAKECYAKYMKEADATADADEDKSHHDKEEKTSDSDVATDVTEPADETPIAADTNEAPAEEVPATEEVKEELAEEKVSDGTPVVSEDALEAIVEKAVKSALESYKSEVAVKVTELEGELALAKSQAVAGGPKRTAKPINLAEVNDFLTKAAGYMAKANATTDPVLAKGFKQLANEFYAKASEADINK